jgi:hypothetical protein
VDYQKANIKGTGLAVLACRVDGMPNFQNSTLKAGTTRIS